MVKNILKKFILILSIFTFNFLILTNAGFGCSKPHYYNFEELKNKVISVEIIDCDKDTKEIRSLYIVEESKIEELLLDLSNIEFTIILGSPQSLDGVALKLIYSDNSYEIIGEYSIDRYDSEGNIVHCDDIYYAEDFGKLIKKYYIGNNMI